MTEKKWKQVIYELDDEDKGYFPEVREVNIGGKRKLLPLNAQDIWMVEPIACSVSLPITCMEREI